MIKRIAQFVIAAAFGMLAGIPPASAQNSWDEIVAKAKAEGEVVFYHSQLGSKYIKDLAAAFEKEYGIRVKLLEGRATEILERVRSEGVANRVTADVVNSSTAVLAGLTQNGLTQELGDIPNLKKLAKRFSASAHQAPLFIQPYGVLINTNLVKPEDAPKSWKDILNPKWKGKIIANDFRTLGAGFGTIGPVWELFGDEYIEALSKQNVTLSRNIRLEERRVATGEFAMLITEAFSFYRELEGLPVAFIAPEPSLPYVPFDLVIVKNAPHPAAAKVFINFLLSEKAQLILANAGLSPVVESKLEGLTGDAARATEFKLMGWIKPDKRAEGMEVMKRYFGK